MISLYDRLLLMVVRLVGISTAYRGSPGSRERLVNVSCSTSILFGGVHDLAWHEVMR